MCLSRAIEKGRFYGTKPVFGGEVKTAIYEMTGLVPLMARKEDAYSRLAINLRPPMLRRMAALPRYVGASLTEAFSGTVSRGHGTPDLPRKPAV